METRKLIYRVLILIMLSACNENDNLKTKDFTPENIPDEIFFKYLLDHFDTNKDGKLSQAEADAVKEINFSSDEFLEVSVAGIEYFKNLEKLTLKSVYVGDTLNLNANTGLKELYLNNTNVQYLDISMITGLEILDCHSNQIKELDVSNNPALKILNCSYNEIEVLDVSKNPLLEILKCEFNNIADLEVSNLPLLSTLHCQNNRLTSINILQNPELQDLEISNNEIAFLNLTQNQKLRRLFCSGTSINALDIRNTVIDSLSCKSINLKSLNAQGSQTLKWLECSAYAEIINAGESTLETINYYPRTISDGYYYTSGCMLSLNNCPNLKAFYFAQEYSYPHGSVHIYDAGMISMEFSNCTSLQTFNANFISGLKIDNCPALKELTCIGVFKNLDLSKNANLEKLYGYSQALETIDITSCTMLKEVDCFGMFETIDFSKNQNVENLRLISGGKLSSFDIDALSMLKYLELVLNNDNTTFKIDQNTALEEIIIRDTIIGNVSHDFGITFDIADLPSLKFLQAKTEILSGITISNCPKLEYILNERSYNYYLYQLPSLEMGITDCRNLQNIYVRTGTLTNFAISDCENLDTIEVANNKLTSITLDKSVKYLDCSSNFITSLDVSGFTKLIALNNASNQLANLNIEGCSSLETLDCPDNDLSSLSTGHLSKLKTLYCNKNQLSDLDISKNLVTDKLNCTDNQINQLIISNKQTFSEFKIDAGTEIVYVD